MASSLATVARSAAIVCAGDAGGGGASAALALDDRTTTMQNAAARIEDVTFKNQPPLKTSARRHLAKLGLNAF